MCTSEVKGTGTCQPNQARYHKSGARAWDASDVNTPQAGDGPARRGFPAKARSCGRLAHRRRGACTVRTKLKHRHGHLERPCRFVVEPSGGGATRPCPCDWPCTSPKATSSPTPGRAVAPSGGGATSLCLCDWPGPAGRYDDRATGGNRLRVPAKNAQLGGRKILDLPRCTLFQLTRIRVLGRLTATAPCRPRRLPRAAAAADADEPPQPRR